MRESHVLCLILQLNLMRLRYFYDIFTEKNLKLG